MKKAPLVSIYITNYNYGSYIKEAIESVLNQSFKDIELIIIDDGSTDNSREIIESYAHLNNTRIIFQKNKGLNVTNNIAMRLAHGKYLVRLDADDYFSEDAIEKMCLKLESDSQLGLVFPDYFLIDTLGDVIAKEQRHAFDKDVSLLDQPAHGACTMIRRSFLEKLGGYNESFSCQDGYDLWIRFTAKYKVANINEPLFYYRQHNSNLTKNEDRILNTRAEIKESFVTKENIKTPKTLGILPIRGEKVNRYSLAFEKFGDEYLIDKKIKAALKANHIDLLVVTSPDKNIQEHVLNNYSNEKIFFIERPRNLARINKDLKDTVEFIFKDERLQRHQFDSFLLMFLEYPFVTANTLDDAIQTMAIFDLDSLISVRQDNSLFYNHDGKGMKAINDQDQFTKIEREAIYKFTAGLMLTKVALFNDQKTFIGQRAGHIEVNQQAAMGLYTDFDVKMAKLIAEQELKLINK